MLTCQQIVALVCQTCKAPGFTAQCGQFLNQVLLDLWQVRNLKMNRLSQPINVGAGTNGPFPLPANYARVYNLFYTVNGMPFKLSPISQEQYDMLFKDPSVADYPYFWDTDWSGISTNGALTPGGSPNLFIYPQTTTGIPLTLRYMCQQPDITTPETSTLIPWFPSQKYLLFETCSMLMMVTDDSRQESFHTQAENILRPYLIMEGDEQEVVKEVKRDPLRFRPFFNLKPTKVTD